MKKLDPNPISKETIQRHLEKGGDSFAFELRVLKAIQELGFICQHGGTYSDPVTDAPRQFDIRADYICGNKIVRLAIECKNIGANFPLLISCIARKRFEAKHSLLLSYRSNTRVIEGVKLKTAFWKDCHCKSAELFGPNSNYRGGQLVGKETVQIGLFDNRSSEGEPEIRADDREIYEKWAQAINSAHSLVLDSFTLSDDYSVDYVWACVVPVVVVPDGHLWAVEYGEDGTQKADAKQVAHCSFYIDRRIDGIGCEFHASHTLSHVEFVTPSGLEGLLNPMKFPDTWFEKDGLQAYLWQHLSEG